MGEVSLGRGAVSCSWCGRPLRAGWVWFWDCVSRRRYHAKCRAEILRGLRAAP